MRKISEIKGEDALDVLAELIDPFSDIAADQLMVFYLRSDKRAFAVKQALKAHKKAVLKILATLEGKDVETYSPSLIELPMMLLELLNDPDVVAVFRSAETAASSGSATENTEKKKKT